MDIEKVSLAIQVDGVVCFVALDQDKLKLLVQMAAGLSDNGKVNAVKAPEDFRFTALDDFI